MGRHAIAVPSHTRALQKACQYLPTVVRFNDKMGEYDVFTRDRRPFERGLVLFLHMAIGAGNMPVAWGPKKRGTMQKEHMTSAISLYKVDRNKMSGNDDSLKQAKGKGYTRPIPEMDAESNRRVPNSYTTTLELHTPEGTKTHVLQDGDTLVVGREEDEAGSFIAIADPFLSSRHAQFTRKNGVLYVSDLSSRNGTLVSGQRIHEPTPLVPGCEVQMGGVTAMVSLGSPNEAPVLPHWRFVVELRKAVMRTASPNNPFALLMIRSPGNSDALQFIAALIQCLPPDCYVALHSNNTIEVLVFEVSFADTRRLSLDLNRKCKQDPQKNAFSLLIAGTVIGEKGYSPPRSAEVECEVVDLLRQTLDRIPEQDRDSPNIKVKTVQSTEGRRSPEGKTLVLHSSLLKRWANLDQIATNMLPILLEGETGVGKTELANHLHERSGLRGKFMDVSCAELSPSLVESELFGHKKGAFSGAVEDKKGFFQSANNGTIFLDEIGELPLAMQAKLLKVVEEGYVRRVGDVDPIKISVRIIAATNRNIAKMVREGTFREDLYQRLKGWQIYIPPLRERSEEEIEELSLALLERAKGTRNNSSASHKIRGFSAETLQMFRRYGWPGNIREMSMSIGKAVSSSLNSMLEPGDFPDLLQELQSGRSPERSVGMQAEAGRPNGGEAQNQGAETSENRSSKTSPQMDSLKLARHQAERERLLEALMKADGRRDKAAEYLQIPVRTFYHRMKVLGIKYKPQG